MFFFELKNLKLTCSDFDLHRRRHPFHVYGHLVVIYLMTFQHEFLYRSIDCKIKIKTINNNKLKKK